MPKKPGSEKPFTHEWHLRLARPSARPPGQSRCGATMNCAAGTPRASLPRRSSASLASTFACSGTERIGRRHATRHDLAQEVHRLPHVRARLLALPRGRLPAVAGPAALRVQSHHDRHQGFHLPADRLRQVPGGLPERRHHDEGGVAQARWRLRQRRQVGSSSEGHVLVVDENKCTNCGDCYDACPYGVIHEHPERKVAFKCDLCDGTPQCISSVRTPTCWPSISRSTRPIGHRSLTDSAAAT